MNDVGFAVEFNNQIDEIKESENDYYAQAEDRLKQLAEGHNDILGGAVNLRLPAKGRHTTYLYEVKIVVHMGSTHIAATEEGKEIQSALDHALDAIERQVHEHREKQRNY
jgi:ribosomal subunit interface protein